MIRPPQLTDDLGHAEVAIEALFAGGTERTVQRAAGLGGNTQGPSVCFRDKYRFHGIAGADVKQPLARAIV